MLPLLFIMTAPIASWAAGEPAASSVSTPAADLAHTTSLAITLLKVFGALIVVVGLMVVVSFWLRKMGLSRTGSRQGTLINVLDTKMIASKKYISVVRIGEETVALGVTDQQITLLTNLDNKTIPLPDSPSNNVGQTSFASLLGKIVRGEK